MGEIVRPKNRVYQAIGDLLEYPGEDWDARLEQCKRRVSDEAPALAERLLAFALGLDGIPIATLQERYTQAFDLNPVCALEVGYHLFGEDYKRGLFLANLRETEAGLDLGQEHQLPDYLPVLLRLLGRLTDEELRSDLIAECLVPAVEKMIAALKQAKNPYGHLLEALVEALKAEVPGRQPALAAAFTGEDAMPELYRISSRAARSREQDQPAVV